MNSIMTSYFIPTFQLYQAIRPALMEKLTDDDLGYSPGGANPSLGVLCREIGEVERAYIDSFKTFVLDFSVHPHFRYCWRTLNQRHIVLFGSPFIKKPCCGRLEPIGEVVPANLRQISRTPGEGHRQSERNALIRSSPAVSLSVICGVNRTSRLRRIAS
jgi:hypothetical protein